MIMLISIHVLIALASIVLASVTFFRPSLKKLFVSYGLIIATVATGTALIITAHSHILETCAVGVSYLVAVSGATIATHVRLRKLARQEI